jgi:hypothetical protein
MIFIPIPFLIVRYYRPEGPEASASSVGKSLPARLATTVSL